MGAFRPGEAEGIGEGTDVREGFVGVCFFAADGGEARGAGYGFEEGGLAGAVFAYEEGHFGGKVEAVEGGDDGDGEGEGGGVAFGRGVEGDGGEVDHGENVKRKGLGVRG